MTFCRSRTFRCLFPYLYRIEKENDNAYIRVQVKYKLTCVRFSSFHTPADIDIAGSHLNERTKLDVRDVRTKTANINIIFTRIACETEPSESTFQNPILLIYGSRIV